MRHSYGFLEKKILLRLFAFASKFNTSLKEKLFNPVLLFFSMVSKYSLGSNNNPKIDK